MGEGAGGGEKEGSRRLQSASKSGIDLTGFYKLYLAKKKYRIIYHLIGKYIEVIEIVGIGKRDKEEIYKLVTKRLKKLGSIIG